MPKDSKQDGMEDNDGASPNGRGEHADGDTPSLPAELPTLAAEFNRRVLRKMQRAFEKDPTVDFTTVFPSAYSRRLAEKREYDAEQEDTQLALESTLLQDGDIEVEQTINNASSVSENDIEIPFELAPDLKDLLKCETQDRSTLQHRIQKLVEEGEVIWRSEAMSDNVVIKCTEEIALKVISRSKDYTEFTTMQYLQKHLPSIPAPRPLGLMTDSRYTYIFMTFMPGIRLDTIWLQLTTCQKMDVVQDLEMILTIMRQHVPEHKLLGGVGGEGCKDARRHVRISKVPIFTASEFIDFLLFEPHFGGKVYIRCIEELWKRENSSVVFTHGDLQPLNILVQPTDNGSYTVAAIIDWESGGMYPEWVECNKATNCFSPMDSEDDWALFLPPSISLQKYTIPWLLDRIWDCHVV